MTDRKSLKRHLPLSEATFYILLMLDEPRHGYGVMQEVARVTGGEVTIGPGTLYGAFSTLENEKLIEMVGEEGRRKSYSLTARGRELLRMQRERLDLMTKAADERGITASREDIR